MLSIEQLKERNVELALKVKETYGNPDLREDYNNACEELLGLNKGLIKKFTYKYGLYNKHNYDKDELFNFLQQHLIKSCTLYDETKGTFITYACNCLRNSFASFFNSDSTKVTSLSYLTHRKVSRILKHITENGLELNEKNVVKYGNIPVKTFREYYYGMYASSLDVEITNDKDKGKPLIDCIADVNTKSPEEIAQETDKKELIHLAISYLNSEHADAIKIYFLEQQELSKILKEKNCTKQNFHSIKNKALAQLKILLQPENLMAIKQIGQLKQKNEKMLENNKEVTFNSLFKNESITSSTLFRMLFIIRNKFFFTQTNIFEKINNIPEEPIELNKNNIEFVKDIILANSPEDISNKYDPKEIDYLLKLKKPRANVAK